MNKKRESGGQIL